MVTSLRLENLSSHLSLESNLEAEVLQVLNPASLLCSGQVVHMGIMWGAQMFPWKDFMMHVLTCSDACMTAGCSGVSTILRT